MNKRKQEEDSSGRNLMMMKNGLKTIARMNLVEGNQEDDEEEEEEMETNFAVEINLLYTSPPWTEISTNGLRSIIIEEIPWPKDNVLRLPCPIHSDTTCERRYDMRWFVKPCVCCGQADHALANLYGEDNEPKTERITCPVSQFDTSIMAVWKRSEDKRNFAIHPWRFVDRYKTEGERMAAWGTYLVDGYGRRQSARQRIRLERAIFFYATGESIGEFEDHTDDKKEPKWYGNNWTPSGPIIPIGKNPYCRRPCIWCGSDDHSVYSEEDDNGTKVRICPIYRTYDKRKNTITLTSDVIAELSAFDRTRTDHIVDKLQFQGLAWTLEISEIELLLEYAKFRCDEVRASWTFKRDIPRLGGNLATSEILDEEGYVSD